MEGAAPPSDPAAPPPPRLPPDDPSLPPAPAPGPAPGSAPAGPESDPDGGRRRRLRLRRRAVSCRLSDGNALEVLTKMVSLGYFHPGADAVDPEVGTGDGSVEAWERWKAGRASAWASASSASASSSSPYGASDPECGIVVTASRPDPAGGEGGEGGSVMTPERLKAEAERALAESGGRARLSDLAGALGVGEDRVAAAAADGMRDSRGGGAVMMVGSELVASSYLDGLVGVVNDILERDGRAVVSELARSVFDLPLDVTLLALTDRIEGGGGGTSMGLIRSDARMMVGGAGGAREIVTRRYEEEKMACIVDALAFAEEPTRVSDLVKESDADAGAVLARVREMCADGTLGGELRGDSGSASSAVYVPGVYEARQRAGVDDFFSVNGYVTTETCSSLGIAAGRAEGFVRESFPGAVRLSDAVINPLAIAAPLEAAIQEAVANDTFADLRLHLPEELASNVDDVRRILADLALPNLDAAAESMDKDEGERPSDGVTVLSDGEALYFSPGMVRRIKTGLLPPLIEEYGKRRAEEAHRAEAESSKKKKKTPTAEIPEEGGGEIIMTGAKLKKAGKRGGRKGGRRGEGGDTDADEDAGRGRAEAAGGKKRATAREKRRARRGAAPSAARASSDGPAAPPTSAGAVALVPLASVARRVAEEYPDLSDVQEGHCPLPDARADADAEGDDDDDDAPRWRDDDDDAEGASEGTGTGGPLYEFCRLALDGPDLRGSCAEAFRAEYDRIAAAAAAGGRGAASHIGECAARARGVERAFEGSFPDACRLVQVLAKLPLSSSRDSRVAPGAAAELESDFLAGCAADFAARLTGYCLFRHDVGGGTFSFRRPDSPDPPLGDDGGGGGGDELPDFCRPPDPAVLSFPGAYLSCPPLGGGGARDPLPVLREALPGGAGVDLARMWASCGGGTHAGGGTRPGSLGEFLRHAEESCLSICGLPFKALDKKSEKQLMFARRQRLSQELERATDPGDVLELSVALLFQQVRGMAVAARGRGGILTGPVLFLLLGERRVPAPVAERFRELGGRLSGTARGEGDGDGDGGAGAGVPEELISAVRDCGLCRDVSKHIFE